MILRAKVYLPSDCLEFVVGQKNVVSINNYKDTDHLVVKYEDGCRTNYYNLPFSYDFYVDAKE